MNGSLTDRLRAALKEMERSEAAVRRFAERVPDWYAMGLTRRFRAAGWQIEREAVWDFYEGPFAEAVDELRGLQAAVRGFVAEAPAWTQRGLHAMLTAEDDGWDIGDGGVRRFFRDPERTPPELVEWAEAEAARLRPAPLPDDVRVWFDGLPRPQRLALMQHAMEAWVEEHASTAPVPPQPEWTKSRPPAESEDLSDFSR